MRYTDEDCTKWIDLYKEGKSFRQISRIVGVPYATISWRIKKLGLIDGRATGRKSTGLSKEELLNNRYERNKQNPCTKCGELNGDRYKTGVTSICKKCIIIKANDYYHKNTQKILIKRKANYDPNKQRIMGLKWHYNISSEEWDIIFKNQNGLCAICENPAKGGTRANARLNLDHNHKTGKIRELLCPKCNQGLGYFNDNIDILQKSINYLKKHQSI